MILLVFGSNTCDNCSKQLKDLKAAGVDKACDLIYVDAFSPDENMQKFCDDHGVDELPCMKLYDGEKKLLIHAVGYFEPAKIMSVLKQSAKN